MNQFPPVNQSSLFSHQTGMNNQQGLSSLHTLHPPIQHPPNQPTNPMNHFNPMLSGNAMNQMQSQLNQNQFQNNQSMPSIQSMQTMQQPVNQNQQLKRKEPFADKESAN